MKKPVRNISVPSIKESFNSRHPFVVPVVTLFGLIVITLVGFLIFGGQVVKPADSKVVTVYADGEIRSIPTRADTVGDMLHRAGITYAKEDLIEPDENTPITNNQFSVNIYRAKQVTVIDDSGKKVIAKIADTTPEVMATKAGYKLYPEDIVTVTEPDKSLDQGVIGTQVVIKRAIPIKMNLYGKTFSIRTQAKTVGDLLADRKINVGDNAVLPKKSTKLKPNSIVFVTQPGKKIKIIEEPIAQDVEYITSTSLALGKEEVREEGRQGKKVVVYSIAADGSRKPLQEIVVVEPVKRVIVRGSSPSNASVAADKAALMAAAGISESEYYAVDFIISHESGWRPGAVSASGQYVGLGQTNPASLSAACPNWQSDAVCQLQFFTSYASRYGGWQKAYFVWQTQGWW